MVPTSGVRALAVQDCSVGLRAGAVVRAGWCYRIHVNHHRQDVNGKRFFLLTNFGVNGREPLRLLVLVMNFKQILGAVGWNQTAVVDLCALEGT